MEKCTLKVKTLPHFKGSLPEYTTALSSGFDVRSRLNEVITLSPGNRILIPTGLSFEIPSGFELQVRPRSGLALKHGLTVLNTPGTIDADYRGEIKILIFNSGKDPVVIKDQERIGQMVLAPVLQAQFELVSELGDTQRGGGGFGSTGV